MQHNLITKDEIRPGFKFICHHDDRVGRDLDMLFDADWASLLTEVIVLGNATPLQIVYTKYSDYPQ